MKNDNPSPPVQPLPAQGPGARALQYDTPPTKPSTPGVAENVDARLLAAAHSPSPPTTTLGKLAILVASQPELSPTSGPTDMFGNDIAAPNPDEKIRMCVVTLLNRMYDVGAHPEFKSMFSQARQAGIWTGAAGNWSKEVKELKEALGL